MTLIIAAAPSLAAGAAANRRMGFAGEKGEVCLAKVIVLTSGKGGVGKTTSAAAIASGLALRGKRTVVIDFDVGLRNLDLIMGCERRVVFDFINVINGDAKLNQALIKDKRNDNLYVFPTSQTRDKEALKRDGVERVLDELKENFDYIVCDSPAGIEHGAITALYFADSAIIVTNPEVSSVRDSDRIIGILASKSRRAEHNLEPVQVHLLLTRYSLERVKKGEMLSVEDVKEILSIPLLGVIPELETVLKASNTGTPVVFDEESPAGRSYLDAVARFVGEQREMRFPPARAPEHLPQLVRESLMRLLDLLFPERRNSAVIAKDRLKIVLAHERASRDAPEFLPALQKDLLEVVGRYVEIRDDTLRVNVGKSADTSLLEINVEIDRSLFKPVNNGAAAAASAAADRAARAGEPGAMGQARLTALAAAGCRAARHCGASGRGEKVDAADLKSAPGNRVRVRVPPSAPVLWPTTGATLRPSFRAVHSA